MTLEEVILDTLKKDKLITFEEYEKALKLLKEYNNNSKHACKC